MSRDLVLSTAAERLRKLALEELFSRAERFGKVFIFSSDSALPPNCYRCRIEFRSIPGTTLEASSEFKRPLLDALLEAIDRAERIVEAYGGGVASQSEKLGRL